MICQIGVTKMTTTLTRPARSVTKSVPAILFGCFVFFFLIMLCAPYTYDDYYFADLSFNSFRELFQFCLEYGNGRLLGNLGVTLLVNHPVVNALIKAFVLAGLVALIPVVLGLRSSYAHIFTFILITAVDANLFAQVYTWSSGFYNYMPPVFWMLVTLLLLQAYSSAKANSSAKILICCALFVIGVCEQLYIEHSAMINLLLSCVLMLKSFRDSKRTAVPPVLILLVANIIGLFLMFWIPVHFHVDDNLADGYRSLSIGNVRTLITSCIKNFLKLTNCYFGMLSIPICGGALVTVSITSASRTEKQNSLYGVLCIVSGLVMVLCAAGTATGWYAEMGIVHHLITSIFVLIPLLIWIIAGFSIADTLLRDRILLLLFFALCSVAPALVVNPVSIRMVIHSYIFITMALFCCLHHRLADMPSCMHRLVKKAILIGAAVLVISLGSIFFSINSMSQARHRYITQQIERGATEISVFHIPFDYVHDYSDLSLWQYYYRSKPGDVKFNVIFYEYWVNEYLHEIT